MCCLPKCDSSADYLSRSLQRVQRHRGRVHQVRHQGAEHGIERVFLQTFFKEKRLQKLFRVTASSIPPAANLVVPDNVVVKNRQAVAVTVFSVDIAQKQQEWIDESFGHIPTTPHKSEETPWLRRTGFRSHLEGVNKKHVWEATADPTRQYRRTFVEADSNSEEDVGLPSLETDSFFPVAQVTRSLLQKAHEAAATVGPRSRLNTQHATILATLEADRQSAQPFRPLQEAQSLRRYTDGWVRFLCYVLKLSNPDTPSPLAHLLHLTEHQLAGVRALRTLMLPDESSLAETENTTWLSLDESLVLEASRLFIAQVLPENVYASALLSYVAARGMKADGSWRTPPYMTSLLASITHVLQLILFADARHEADQLPTRSRTSFEQLLQTNCRSWLVNGRDTPSAEILSWRLYAQRVSANTLPPAYTSWSSDGETVTHRDSILTMTNWRAFIQAQLRSAQAILEGELLFDQADRPQPRVRYLVDLETETRPGYSFVEDACNGLRQHGQ